MYKICLIMLCVFSTGCASFNVAKPIEPKSGWPHKFAEVNSLQPVLSWKQKFDGEADFVLYEGPYTEDQYICCGKQSIPGKVVYIERNISGSKHKVKVMLKPNRGYFWAIRKSGPIDDSVGWSTYQYHAFYGLAVAHFYKELFKFKTPSQ